MNKLCVADVLEEESLPAYYFDDQYENTDIICHLRPVHFAFDEPYYNEEIGEWCDKQGTLDEHDCGTLLKRTYDGNSVCPECHICDNCGCFYDEYDWCVCPLP